MDTQDSYNYYGIQSSQHIHGDGVSAVSAFTDTGSVWHAIALVAYSNSTVKLHYEYNDGNYHFKEYCTDSFDTYYKNNITWSSGSVGFLYKGAGCGTTWDVQESSSHSQINSDGSVDMMESSDYTNSDYTTSSPIVIFSPGLEYMTSGGSWIHASNVDSYNSASSSPPDNPPSNPGNYINCTPSVWGLDAAGYTQYPDGGDGQTC
jgi:hypothetical protein